MKIDYDNLPNPTPREAALMPALELHTILFRRNYGQRNTTDPYWWRLHRQWAKNAIDELRYLTGRQRKNMCYSRPNKHCWARR